MPEISRFDGIVITMYFNEHNPPHFHATYNGVEALFDLNEGAFIKGTLPSRQARLVLAWYELHKDELMQIWNSKEFKKIKPLS
ncbi:MAG: DUF4160 domain-containing protein [Oscillospiraceae bacterium]|nr:DUF4160 domain-containing protein [Oscillospiraceae bacterium]